MGKNTADGFVREIDVEFEEFIADSATTPRGIINFHVFNDLFRFF